MPATMRGNAAPPFVLGVDGCRGGWVAAKLDLAGNATVSLAATFAGLLAGPGRDAEALIVDMPIGLAEAGRRGCETLAREKLKPGRTSSVFASPRRPMLAFGAYGEANAWGKANGAGLSKQAWMIMPKIRELDAAIGPEDQVRIGEGHPEVAFARLRGGLPCAHSKRRPEGLSERRAVLAGAGLDAEALFLAAHHTHGPDVGRDDVYDALALALTARDRLAGKAWRLTDGARDARGLIMEIWG